MCLSRLRGAGHSGYLAKISDQSVARRAKAVRRDPEITHSPCWCSRLRVTTSVIDRCGSSSDYCELDRAAFRFRHTEPTYATLPGENGLLEPTIRSRPHKSDPEPSWKRTWAVNIASRFLCNRDAAKGVFQVGDPTRSGFNGFKSTPLEPITPG